MVPLASPGTLTDEERFMFDVFGYLVIPDALSPAEVQACLDASIRAHDALPEGEWRQIGHLYETEPAIEALIDHPSVIDKVRAIMGDYFILQSSWCTKQPSNGKAGGYHQDGSSVYDFRRLAPATPLLQLRVGYYLTDQSDPDAGNMVMIPGSHNSQLRLPKSVKPDLSDFSSAPPRCAVRWSANGNDRKSLLAWATSVRHSRNRPERAASSAPRRACLERRSGSRLRRTSVASTFRTRFEKAVAGRARLISRG